MKVQKKKKKEEEKSRIIAKIQGEHISSLPESQQIENKTYPKIKQEHDCILELAYSIRASSWTENHQELKQCDNDYEENEHIEQEELQKMKKEIDMLRDIEENKCTMRYCIKEEDKSGQDLSMFDMAMDISYIQDKDYYGKFIQKKLPRLYDQITPSLLREIAFLAHVASLQIGLKN